MADPGLDLARARAKAKLRLLQVQKGGEPSPVPSPLSPTMIAEDDDASEDVAPPRGIELGGLPEPNAGDAWEAYGTPAAEFAGGIMAALPGEQFDHLRRNPDLPAQHRQMTRGMDQPLSTARDIETARAHPVASSIGEGVPGAMVAGGMSFVKPVRGALQMLNPLQRALGIGLGTGLEQSLERGLRNRVAPTAAEESRRSLTDVEFGTTLGGAGELVGGAVRGATNMARDYITRDAPNLKAALDEGAQLSAFSGRLKPSPRVQATRDAAEAGGEAPETMLGRGLATRADEVRAQALAEAQDIEQRALTGNTDTVGGDEIMAELDALRMLDPVTGREIPGPRQKALDTVAKEQWYPDTVEVPPPPRPQHGPMPPMLGPELPPAPVHGPSLPPDMRPPIYGPPLPPHGPSLPPPSAPYQRPTDPIDLPGPEPYQRSYEPIDVPDYEPKAYGHPDEPIELPGPEPYRRPDDAGELPPPSTPPPPPAPPLPKEKPKPKRDARGRFLKKQPDVAPDEPSLELAIEPPRANVPLIRKPKPADVHLTDIAPDEPLELAVEPPKPRQRPVNAGTGIAEPLPPTPKPPKERPLFELGDPRFAPTEVPEPDPIYAESMSYYNRTPQQLQQHIGEVRTRAGGRQGQPDMLRQHYDDIAVALERVRDRAFPGTATMGAEKEAVLGPMRDKLSALGLDPQRAIDARIEGPDIERAVSALTKGGNVDVVRQRMRAAYKSDPEALRLIDDYFSHVQTQKGQQELRRPPTIGDDEMIRPPGRAQRAVRTGARALASRGQGASDLAAPARLISRLVGRATMGTAGSELRESEANGY